MSSPTLSANLFTKLADEEEIRFVEVLYSVKLKVLLVEGWFDITVQLVGATIDSFMYAFRSGWSKQGKTLFAP